MGRGRNPLTEFEHRLDERNTGFDRLPTCFYCGEAVRGEYCRTSYDRCICEECREIYEGERDGD